MKNITTKIDLILEKEITGKMYTQLDWVIKTQMISGHLSPKYAPIYPQLYSQIRSQLKTSL